MRKEAVACAGTEMGERHAMGAGGGNSGDGTVVFAERGKRNVAAWDPAHRRTDSGRIVPGSGSVMRKMAKAQKTGRIFRGKRGIKGEDIGGKKRVIKKRKKVLTK